MLTLRHNGKNLKNFQNARVLRDIEQLCGVFSFTSTADDENLFPVRGGDEVEILADDITLLTGYVDAPDMTYSLTLHSINITGRDKLQDLVDDTIVKPVEFSGIGLVTIIKTVLADLGINVDVINKAGKIENFSDSGKESSGVGQNAFEFLESFARMRQIFLTSDFESNVVLLRGNPGEFKTKFQHIKNGDDNNIKKARFRDNISGRFYKYIVEAQLDLYFQDENVTAEDAASQLGRAFDTQIRKSRVLVMNAEETANSETAQARAEWEANIRRARSFMYTATLAGHSEKGELWDFNKTGEIIDTFADLNGEFLCKQVEYLYSIEGGSTTNLIFTYKDAYTLQAEQAQREINQGGQGEGFFG